MYTAKQNIFDDENYCCFTDVNSKNALDNNSYKHLIECYFCKMPLGVRLSDFER